MSKEVILVVLNLVLLLGVQVTDSMISTTKTILIQKNKRIYAAIMVVFSQLIFYKIVSVIAHSENDYALYVVAFGGGLGTYMAIAVSNRFSKEKLFVNVIISDDKVEMLKLREYLIENKINNLVTDGYTDSLEKTLAITAYTETKAQNKLLDTYLDLSSIEFKRIVS